MSERRMTGYKSIRTDAANTGDEFMDEVKIVVSRCPDDLTAICDAIGALWRLALRPDRTASALAARHELRP